MKSDLSKHLADLKAIKEELDSGSMDPDRADQLLAVLTAIKDHNEDYRSDLSRICLVTLNLLVSSAIAGGPGIFTGLSAQYVHNLSDHARENSLLLTKLLEQLTDELGRQIGES